MTNDTNTLNGALQELGETMASNLVSMGVSGASASDGLTTLANNILDIAPSVGGITPTVSIDLSRSPTLICRGATVDIMALVHADYDDTSQTDVDLKGYLQGATVTFKNGNDSIGYAVSDNDGIATLVINDIAMGNYSIVGSFDGTGTDYESATSSALTFTVNDYPTLVLSADKTTVNVGETVTFTVTAEYNNTPVVGYPIQLYKDGSSMGSLYAGITNSNGTCTITYTIGSSDTNIIINANTLSNDVNIIIELYDAILLQTNKNILSYIDSDTCTLTGQLTKNGTSIAVSGVPITFKQGSTTLGTATTDNTGLATLTDAYTSTNAGNITCTATDGTITSSSITIEDIYKYDSNTYQCAGSRQVILQDVPSNFRITYTLHRTNSSNGCTLCIGNDNNNHFLFGGIGNGPRYNGFAICINNNWSVTQHSTTIPTNEDVEVICTYEDGTCTYIANGATTTVSKTYTDRTYLFVWYSDSSGYVKDIKVETI